MLNPYQLTAHSGRVSPSDLLLSVWPEYKYSMYLRNKTDLSHKCSGLQWALLSLSFLIHSLWFSQLSHASELWVCLSWKFKWLRSLLTTERLKCNKISVAVREAEGLTSPQSVLLFWLIYIFTAHSPSRQEQSHGVFSHSAVVSH